MKYIIIVCLFFCSILMSAQVDVTSELYQTLKTNDSLLFEVGFNQCDIEQFEKLLSENCEFYHDQSGIVDSKEAIVANTRDGLCKMDYKARRALVEGSLEVYPMMNNGILYGALQTGIHKFYAIEKDKPEYFTSIAKFTHLWIFQDEVWQLSRIISYDHQTTDRD